MSELVEFLLARITEDEAAAKAAKGWRAWHVEEKRTLEIVTEVDGSMGWEFGGGSGVWGCDDPYDDCDQYRTHAYLEADHIVRHDPARVLAECEAKRRIIEIHGCSEGGLEVWLDAPDIPDWPGFTPGYYSRDACACCADLMLDLSKERRWPCRTIRALAQPYRDHPDFKPEWVI